MPVEFQAVSVRHSFVCVFVFRGAFWIFFNYLRVFKSSNNARLCYSLIVAILRTQRAIVAALRIPDDAARHDPGVLVHRPRRTTAAAAASALTSWVGGCTRDGCWLLRSVVVVVAAAAASCRPLQVLLVEMPWSPPPPPFLPPLQMLLVEMP
jgi:hypothetical protein